MFSLYTVTNGDRQQKMWHLIVVPAIIGGLTCVPYH